MLRLKDLKQQGLHLSQLEAQEIHSAINGVSQGHNPTGIIFEKSVSQPIKENIDLSLQLKEARTLDAMPDKLAAHLTEFQQSDESNKLIIEPEQSVKIKNKPGRKPNK